VYQPPDFEVKGEEDKNQKLKKVVYGLKQAPRAWYNRIDSYMINNGFNRNNNDPMLYTRSDHEEKILIVCLYVDDMIYTDNIMLEKFKAAMKTKFEMTDLGLMKYFLGIEVEQSANGIFSCQQKYATNILKRFRMDKCKAIGTPIALGTKLSKQDEDSSIDSNFYKRLIGSLM
jgi:hypothetical protein